MYTDVFDAYLTVAAWDHTGLIVLLHWGALSHIKGVRPRFISGNKCCWNIHIFVG